jgi:hypothetical protein
MGSPLLNFGVVKFWGLVEGVGALEFGGEYGGGLSELDDVMCDSGYVDGVMTGEFGR